MKILSILSAITISTILLCSFIRVNPNETTKASVSKSDYKWYICSYCCKTKQAESAPWDSGCKVSSSGTHNYNFLGKAGDYNYTCRYCDAEIYMTPSTSPAASKCCSGQSSTHSWEHK